jgi:hypothetical protein
MLLAMPYGKLRRSPVAERLPRHPVVKGLSPGVVATTGREKMMEK